MIFLAVRDCKCVAVTGMPPLARAAGFELLPRFRGWSASVARGTAM